MKQLNKIETVQIAGGKLYVTDPTVSPLCAGYVIGVYDHAITYAMLTGDPIFAGIMSAATLLSGGNEGMCSQFELDRIIDSVIEI